MVIFAHSVIVITIQQHTIDNYIQSFVEYCLFTIFFKEYVFFVFLPQDGKSNIQYPLYLIFDLITSMAGNNANLLRGLTFQSPIKLTEYRLFQLITMAVRSLNKNKMGLWSDLSVKMMVSGVGGRERAWAWKRGSLARALDSVKLMVSGTDL